MNISLSLKKYWIYLICQMNSVLQSITLKHTPPISFQFEEVQLPGKEGMRVVHHQIIPRWPLCVANLSLQVEVLSAVLTTCAVCLQPPTSPTHKSPSICPHISSVCLLSEIYWLEKSVFAAQFILTKTYSVL